jgi:capsular polysaccharide biosynthesis protein
LEEIVKYAEKEGYMIFRPEFHSFIDQVYYFSNAKKIIGPSGAWLANLIFAKEDCIVYILYPETAIMDKSIWSVFGDILNIKVSDYYFKVKEINLEQPVQSDFEVKIEKFEELL